jgi:hypothetical protein
MSLFNVVHLASVIGSQIPVKHKKYILILKCFVNLHLYRNRIPEPGATISGFADSKEKN